MTKTSTFCTILFILVAVLAVFISAQEPATSDLIYFSPTYGHQDHNLFTDFDGYITCNRDDGCPQSDILSLTINNSHPEMDTRSKFVTIDVYLEDGTIFSQAPLNQTLFIGITSKLPMKTIRGLNKGETLYLSGQIEWHGISETGTTSIEFGYGATYETAIKKTYVQPFLPDVKQSDEVFPSLETKTNIQPWPYQFVVYAQTPTFLTTKFTIRPFGGIYYNDVKCTIDNLEMSVEAVYHDDDFLKKVPDYILTIPANHAPQYQSFKPETQVQIQCSGFMHNTGSINRGITVVFHGKTESQIGITTIHRLAKSLAQQTPAMALADATVQIAVPDYNAYTMKGTDANGDTKFFSYHTIHVELSSTNLIFPSNKTMHLYLDGIGGGAIVLSRWSLTVRDSLGVDLPYTKTDKLKVAWYADGKVARFDTWTISLTNEMRQRYDPTQGARLTISYVLSFPTTTVSPPVLTPTTMVGIEQDIHWVNFASTKQTVTFYQFATPVLSRMGMVASENFVFNVFHYEHEDDSHDENSHADDEKKDAAKVENYLMSSSSSDPHSPDFIGTQVLYGFNATIANVQYLDYERPSHFTLIIPTREFNFAGTYDDCTLNTQPIKIVDPEDYSKPLNYVNHQVLVFNQTLQPSVNYSLLCPHAFLTNSSSSSSDRHKDKDIMIEFIATSSSPDTNFYNLVAIQFMAFGDHDHNHGTVFATVTMLTLSVLFACVIGWIIFDNRRKKQALEGTTNSGDIQSGADGDSPIPSGQQSTQLTGKYQQFSDDHH